MANKMKNGLFRVQVYLTEAVFEKLSAERRAYNQTRENAELSESGFCQLKLTGTLPRLPGAPRRNKNAAGRRKKESTLASDSAVANIYPEGAPEFSERSESEQEMMLSEDYLFGAEAESFAVPESGNEKIILTKTIPVATASRPGESTDSLTADRPPNLPAAKRGYDENTFRLLIEGLAGEKSKSDEGKALLEEEDFDELLMSVDRLGTQTESEDAEKKNVANTTANRSDVEDAPGGSRIPHSERAEEQLSLFNF